MLPITQKVRALIAAQKGRETVEAELKRPENGYVSLRENAMRLVKEGITTSGEVLRVINEDV